MIRNATLLGLMLLLCLQIAIAQAERPLEIADQYLQAHHNELGLTQKDVSDYLLSSKVVSKHNKLTHVYLQQAYTGIPVFNAIINLNIKEDGSMLSLGNRFTADLAAKVNTTQPQISPDAAVEAVRSYFQLEQREELKLLERTSSGEFIFEHRGLALEPIKVELMYQPLDDQVRLAWNVDFYEPTAQHWWITRVDALTGQVLDYFDQVVHCEFDAPVHNHDNCNHDHDDLPSVPAGSASFFSGDGDGSAVYNVYPLYVESPNHGSRDLLTSPWELGASPFGWHDTDGADGAEYTITRGNNVHAYHDIFNLNESPGDEPDGGDSLNFDFPLSFNPPQPYTQLDAATTNLFYWNNIIHDIFYQYGFDEQSGNFQENNYGNGGQGADYVRAEALDGSGTNNANFGTPPDGSRPRMQMYLWGGNLPGSFGSSPLIATAPEEVAGEYDYAAAQFGADLDEGISSLEVVLALDTVGITTNACEDIVNAADLVGKMAMIDRGDCQFGFKALAAEQAGAVAVMICNNDDSEVFAMGPGAVGDQVTIPAIMVSRQDCEMLKMGLPGLTIEIEPGGALQVPLPGPSGRDSDFDNGVIVHEYGHGISNRLTGGPSQSGCLTNFEQAGEGWSDWFALVMTTTSADFAEEGRGIGTYASGQQPTGGGIRPFPYSRDFGVDPHTYSDINGVSVPHGVGSVWCVMIWDLYWNLVDEYGFDDDLYFGTGGNNIAIQLVMDGLKLQACSPTFLDSRDAILEADEINYNGANRCLIWETFARRGLGVNAVEGGDENFDLPNTCPPAFRVVKTAVEEANAGDIITYQLDIVNGRNSAIDEAVVIDMLPEGTTFVEGSSGCDIVEDNGMLLINLGTADSGQEFNCTYQLQTATAPFSEAAFEDPISNAVNWTFTNLTGSATWALRINNTNTGILSLFANNVDEVSDQILLQEEPVFLGGLKPGLMFYHEYRTEENLDGGVVEISLNGGEDWEDVGAENFIMNGYGSELQGGSGNPLSGRPAFTGVSGGFIRSLVDLSAYAGETVLIRFRFGTNDSGAREGWYVDDITLFGNLETITNTACTDNDGEQLCSSVTTILYGESPNSTENVLQDRPLELFPNPTNGSFVISLDQPIQEQVTIDIRSIDGRLLKRYNYQSFQREEIDLSAYSAGVYIMQFRSEEGVTTRRVIKE